MMWEIRSSDVGYHLYKDGQLKANLYGFYRDWVEVMERLNDDLTTAAPDAATRRILTPGDVMLGTMLANGDLKPPRR